MPITRREQRMRRAVVIFLMVVAFLFIFRNLWMPATKEWRHIVGPTSIIANWAIGTPVVEFKWPIMKKGEYSSDDWIFREKANGWMIFSLVIGWIIAIVLTIATIGGTCATIDWAWQWSTIPPPNPNDVDEMDH